jgi:small subunit ribosomal protein S16
MSVKIRLTRMGRRNRPFYRLIVADARSPRDGRHVEVLGHYDPLTGLDSSQVNEERALYWLGVGAQPTEAARSLLRKAGVLAKFSAANVPAAGEAVASEPVAAGQTTDSET